MTEEEKKEESGVFEALKLAGKIDWKGMALILTALLGAGGAVWNKVELYVQQYQQREVAQETKTTNAAAGGAYEALATRLDELFTRIEALEKKANVEKVEYVPVPGPPPPSSMGDAVVPASGPGKAKTKAMAAAAPPVETKPEPVSVRFEKARLPEFQAVQQAAKDDLEQFIQEVKTK